MTLTLEIAPEIERALEAKAQRAGVPVADYAVRVLVENVADSGVANETNGSATAESPPKTPAEIMREISALSVDSGRAEFGSESPQKTPAEIRREIAALSIRYGRVETASVDHDKILYGEGYGR